MGIESDTSDESPSPCLPGREAILGTQEYQDVLYSERRVDRDLPDGYFPGDREYEIEENVKHAQRTVNEPYQVIVPPALITFTGEGFPFMTVPFWDLRVVRGQALAHRRGPPQYENDGRARESAYRSAMQSDRFDVELTDTDYTSGSVEITVERV
jgi:hypothetical protein